MKHNKSNTTFGHEMVIIFSPINSSDTKNVISSFNVRTDLSELFSDAMIIP